MRAEEWHVTVSVLGEHSIKQHVWSDYFGLKPGRCSILLKMTEILQKTVRVSLAGSDKSKATGRALTVKTDTAVLISTKDNEM